MRIIDRFVGRSLPGATCSIAFYVFIAWVVIRLWLTASAFPVSPHNVFARAFFSYGWVFLVLAFVVAMGLRSILSLSRFLLSMCMSFLWVVVAWLYFFSRTQEDLLPHDYSTRTYRFFIGLFACGGWLFIVAAVSAWKMSQKADADRKKKLGLEPAPAPSGPHGTTGGAETAAIRPGEATAQDLERAGLIRRKFGEGVRLGFDQTGEVIRYTGEAHGILVAPSRSGKGRDFLQGISLEWPDSMVIIDPKGEIAAITKDRRAMLGPVFILNPYDELPTYLGPSAHYNPMATLDPKAVAFDSDCDALAEAIVVHKGAGEEHWSDAARDLVSGLMMYLVETHPAEANLGYVRDIITDETLLRQMCWEAKENGSRAVRQRLTDFAKADADNKGELASIISNAKTQMKFVATAIDENLSRSDFRFSDLKERPTTVYVILPNKYHDVSGKWFRLIVAAAFIELMRAKEHGVPVLSIIDEFACIGNLQKMRDVMAQSAGFGLRVLPVLQDLTQPKTTYGAAWETFIANTEFRIFLAANDATTRKYVSDLAGTIFRPRTSITRGTSFAGGGSFQSMVGNLLQPSTSESSTTTEHEEPVIRPHEVGQVPDDEFLMFARGVPHMIRGKRAPYFDEKRCPEFRGLYKANPFYKGKAGAK